MTLPACMRLVRSFVTPAISDDLAIRSRAQHDHARANFVAQLIDQRPHLAALQIIDAMREHFHASHL